MGRLDRNLLEALAEEVAGSLKITGRSEPWTI